VPISINKGVPITMDSPGHPVSQAIMKLADQRIIGEAAGHGRLARSRRKRRAA
jgi:pilus assembly protein CpaE